MLRTSLKKTIKVKTEVMSKDFPSMWLEMSEPNKESAFISGFYRQWTYKGIKSDALQIEQKKKLILIESSLFYI